MAPPAKYPRATVRALVKAHASKRVAREVDALVYLNYVLFLEQLMKNAERKSEGKMIAARDLRRISERTLRKFKG